MLDLIPPWALACAIVLVCAWLNRVAGGGLGGQYLPGRALFWVAPAIALLAWTVNPWPVALALGLGFLIWRLTAWGFILSRVGDHAPDRSPDATEAWLLRLPTLGAVLIRMLFVLPGVAAVAWLKSDWSFLGAAPVFAVAATGVYAILFRPLGSHDWMRAELATGALWGLLINSPNLGL